MNTYKVRLNLDTLTCEYTLDADKFVLHYVEGTNASPEYAFFVRSEKELEKVAAFPERNVVCVIKIKGES